MDNTDFTDFIEEINTQQSCALLLYHETKDSIYRLVGVVFTAIITSPEYQSHFIGIPKKKMYERWYNQLRCGGYSKGGSYKGSYLWRGLTDDHLLKLADKVLWLEDTTRKLQGKPKRFRDLIHLIGKPIK